MSRTLKRNGITRKRGTRLNQRYKAGRGLQFLDDIRKTPMSSVAALDEMSVMLNIAPSYGYVLRGKRAVISQPSRRTVSFMLTLCVCPDGIVDWALQSGSITAKSFSETLVALPEGLTLVFDNATVHRATKASKSRVFRLLQRSPCQELSRSDISLHMPRI